LQNESIPLSFEEIEGTLSEVNRKAVPSCYMKPSNRFKKAPWLPLKGYFGSSIIVPYFLTNPDYINKPFLFDDFDYSTLSDIPTNNGTAIGTSFEEAMIHAVNELIERDAISCFLLSVFGRKNPKKVRIIDKNSLPLYLSETLAMIERDYNDELLIVDIMNDLKFPVFLVTFTKQNQPIQPIGFGASLTRISHTFSDSSHTLHDDLAVQMGEDSVRATRPHPSEQQDRHAECASCQKKCEKSGLSTPYALERAILEALQSLHLYDEDLRAEDAQILSKFSQWPKLQKCAQCNLFPLMKAGHYSLSKFHESTNCSGDLARISHTFSEQIAALPIEIASQVGEDSVHATRPRPLERQDHRAEYASCQRKCEKSGLDEVLDTIIRNLEQNDLHVFYAKHYQSGNGISCVKVVIPGIEQFHRVRLGNFVIPGARGISVLSKENDYD
jgi:hypothetical protein